MVASVPYSRYKKYEENIENWTRYDIVHCSNCWKTLSLPTLGYVCGKGCHTTMSVDFAAFEWLN